MERLYTTGVVAKALGLTLSVIDGAAKHQSLSWHKTNVVTGKSQCGNKTLRGIAVDDLQSWLAASGRGSCPQWILRRLLDAYARGGYQQKLDKETGYNNDDRND